MALSIADLSKEDLFGQGHAGCGGCGAAVAGRQAMKALGSRTIITIPASCMATLGGSNLKTTWQIPFYHTLFEMAPAISSGIRAALEAQGIEDVNVVSWAGDAGTADIGFQSLTGAAERNEHMIHVCYDNEMYMNTGGQTGSQTPMYAITSNMTKGKMVKKKNMLAIMEAHGIDYVASASIAYPLDLIAKFRKAAEKPGFSYIHILAPCHRGWQIPPEKTIEFARLAVDSGLFELYEVDNGLRTRTFEPPLIPVEDYLINQGRFRHLTSEQVAGIQKSVNAYYSRGGSEK
ncbi:2-oxoacid:ferredoxin oxidoreductase, beta subunit [Desulfosporosinus orientis DSM 765]|uniref:2-oxoacid:ferredoxin oxidoreductase, beta subunit n=1 Tax=Desulfosporosinus orientis (strain ATCC 19365 / DSM 765 / NCIMB 8382 / VKM B-1628 / Singapore I) TaxID=768706 RepID=G7WC21_DESOD|nr:thiamine pyrophosphate-dependent enzyme [Desulfosporosinus orientis]AET69995.1 2-oxoacid:ferredoxin oxidoreductase, beta subunit [Desulfosporosinus orientis DSM 765]